MMHTKELLIFLAIILISSSITTISPSEAKLPENLPDVSKAPQKVRIIEGENMIAYARTFLTTVDDPSNHLTPSGNPHDGVALLSVSLTDGDFWCSGTLLPTGEHILTAAHCITDISGNYNLLSGSATFEGDGGTVTIAFDVDPTKTLPHPNYDGDFLKGNDIAILKLVSPAPAEITRMNFSTNDNSVGEEIQKIGYGISGFFISGEDRSNWDVGTKRDGKNMYDAFGDVMYNALGMVSGVDYVPQGVYQLDSDDGLAVHDAFDFFFDITDIGLGTNEVMTAGGDSGGPTLADTDNDGVPDTIVGVSSYGITLAFRTGPPSLRTSDCTIQGIQPDSSCGEFAGDTRVSMYADWINSVLPPPKFLEIKGDPVNTSSTSYQVIVTGQISLGSNANPNSDIISPDGTTLNGIITPTGLDDLYFTGDIVSITAVIHIFSFVDGVEVSNGSPSFLEIKGDPITSGITTYQIVVSGQITKGPNANTSDILSPDGTTIDGLVKSTGVDDYSFTGNVVSITATQHVFSFVDGVEVSNGSPPP